VQETFLSAQRLFHRFDGRTAAELMLWLKAILRNTSAHMRRSYRTARRAAFREVPIDAAVSSGVDLRSPDSSPSAMVQREESATLLQAATERLSPRDREVLRMKHHDELTFEEVGRRLAISTVAARKAWLKAVERLREQLEATEAY
jgi:RNA polymerase sigma-70 factor (ECF subfamily)